MALIFDIETCSHPCAAEFLPAPDVSTITAAKNLRDPDKIAEDLQRRKEAALADHASSLGRAALDWNLSRIVALAWLPSEHRDVVVHLCRDEAEEIVALRAFWSAMRRSDHKLIGFCARTFDVPTCIQRSRLLGIPHPHVNLGRYGRGDVTDLRDLLTFDDARYEALMPRSLKVFCQRFGIPVEDAIAGGDIPALVAAGDWAAVEAHVTSDVRLTAALHRRVCPLVAA
jgi:hypothetical protein